MMQAGLVMMEICHVMIKVGEGGQVGQMMKI